jgi:hypothetical protein
MYAPVIPLLFAGFQGQRAIFCTICRDDRDVHSGCHAGHRRQRVDCERHPGWALVALLVLAIAALALIFPQFAQRIAGPAVSAGMP